MWYKRIAGQYRAYLNVKPELRLNNSGNSRYRTESKYTVNLDVLTTNGRGRREKKWKEV